MKFKYTSSFGISLIYAIIFTLPLVIIAGLSDGGVFAGDDSGLYFYFPEVPLAKSIYAWDGVTGFGRASSTAALNLEWNFFVFLFASLVKNSWLFCRIVLYLFFASTNIFSFLYFKAALKTLVQSENRLSIDIDIASLLGSVSYTYSIYSMFMLNQPYYGYHNYIAVLPLLLLCIHNICFQGNKLKYYIVAAFAVVILLNCNPSHTILVILTIASYLLVFKKNIANKILFRRNLILTALVTLLLSAFSWMPLLGHFLNADIKNPYGNIISDDIIQSLNFNSSRGEMLKSLVGLNYPFYDGLDYAIEYSKKYTISIINYLTLVLIFFGITFYKRSTIIIYWLVLVLGFLFLSMGSHPPFGGAVTLLFEVVPGFGMFRAVYHKFYIFVAFGMALLTSVAVYKITFLIKKSIFKKIFFILIFLGLVIRAYPFFNGQFLMDEYKSKLPNEYTWLRKFFLRSKDDGLVLALPSTPNGAGTLQGWGAEGQMAGPHVLSYMGKPFLDSFFFIEKGKYQLTVSDSWGGSGIEQNLAPLIEEAKNLGVRWVWVQKDGFNVYKFRPSKEETLVNLKIKASTSVSILDKQSNVRKLEDNDYFALYEFTDANKYNMVRIY